MQSLILAVIAFVNAASVHRQGSLGAACDHPSLAKLTTLAGTTNAIFAMGINEELPSSRRLRRHHQGADLHQHADRFMMSQHASLTEVLGDLEALGNLNERANQIKRAIGYMTQIIELDFGIVNLVPSSNNAINMDLVEERALISLKQVTETFISIGAQCGI